MQFVNKFPHLCSDDFAFAKLQLKRAEVTSELESEATPKNSKRRASARTRRQAHSSSSNESVASDDEPVRPKVVKKPTQNPDSVRVQPPEGN